MTFFVALIDYSYMNFLMYLNPLLLVIGVFALLLSPFGWVFIAISIAVYFSAIYKKTA